MTTNIGRNIRALCDKRGVSLFELATAIGVSPSTITRLANGEAEQPRKSTLAAIARGLRVTPDYLRAEPGSMPEPEQAMDTEDWSEMMAARRPEDETVCPFPQGRGQNITVKKMEGGAMAPTICDGETLWIKCPSKNFPAMFAEELADGDIVLALPKGAPERPVVRRLIRGENAMWLRPDNPGWPERETVQAGVVLGIVVAKAALLKP